MNCPPASSGVWVCSLETQRSCATCTKTRITRQSCERSSCVYMYIRWKRNVDDAHAPKFTVTPPPSPERSYLLHSNARNAYLCASYLCVAKGSFRRSLCARALGAGETRANASRKSPQPRGEESLRERSGHTRQGQTTRAIQLANSFIPLHCT